MKANTEETPWNLQKIRRNKKLDAAKNKGLEKLVPNNRAIELLETVLAPEDKICIEGNNQKRLKIINSTIGSADLISIKIKLFKFPFFSINTWLYNIYMNRIKRDIYNILRSLAPVINNKKDVKIPKEILLYNLFSSRVFINKIIEKTAYVEAVERR